MIVTDTIYFVLLVENYMKIKRTAFRRAPLIWGLTRKGFVDFRTGNGERLGIGKQLLNQCFLITQHRVTGTSRMPV